MRGWSGRWCPLPVVGWAAALLALASTAAAAGRGFDAVAHGPRREASPESRTIFGREPWYRSRPEPERAWSGTLRRREAIAGPNPRTALRYTLATAAGDLAVYAPSAELEAFLGGDVVVRGKLVDLSAEGFGTELWPASIARSLEGVR